MKLARSHAALLVIAFSLSARASAQSPADSALVFESMTTSAAQGLPFRSSLRTRTIEIPNATRVETLERSATERPNPFAQPIGGYRITFADGRMIAVDTVKREYYETNISTIFNKNSPIMQMIASLNVKPLGATIEVVEKGPGDVILGHKTSEWQTHNVMNMSMAANGDTVVMTSDQLSTIYFADDIRHVAPASVPGVTPDSEMVASLKSFSGMDSTATREISKLPKTLPLRMVSKASMLMGPIDMLVSVTMDVTRIERTAVDPSLFEIPKGYKKVEAPSLAPPRDM